MKGLGGFYVQLFTYLAVISEFLCVDVCVCVSTHAQVHAYIQRLENNLSIISQSLSTTVIETCSPLCPGSG